MKNNSIIIIVIFYYSYFLKNFGIELFSGSNYKTTVITTRVKSNADIAASLPALCHLLLHRVSEWSVVSNIVFVGRNFKSPICKPCRKMLLSWETLFGKWSIIVLCYTIITVFFSLLFSLRAKMKGFSPWPGKVPSDSGVSLHIYFFTF